LQSHTQFNEEMLQVNDPEIVSKKQNNSNNNNNSSSSNISNTNSNIELLPRHRRMRLTLQVAS